VVLWYIFPPFWYVNREKSGSPVWNSARAAILDKVMAQNLAEWQNFTFRNFPEKCSLSVAEKF
jgi:hypothetical protein